jgi:hypothetical protein
MLVLAREASDRVDLTASSVGHLVNHGRDHVHGGAQRLHPHDTTRHPACSVNVTLAEVCVPWPGLGRPLTRSIQPHLTHGHVVNHGRDSVDGGGRSLHPHATTGDPACSVSVTLTEVCVPRFWLGRPLTGSIQPHLPWAT